MGGTPTGLTVDALAQTVKAKYPDYSSQDNNALVQRLVLKHPEYQLTLHPQELAKITPGAMEAYPRPQKQPGVIASTVQGAKSLGSGIADVPRSILQFAEAGNRDSVLGSWPEKQVGEGLDYRARAQQALTAGDPVAFIGHMLNSVLAPTMIPQSVEGLSQTAQQDPLRAAGQLTGMALLEKAPEIMPSKVGLQRALTIGPKLTEEALTKRSSQIGEDVAKYGQQTQDWQSTVKGKIQQTKISEPQAFAEAEAKHQQRVQTIQQANAESQAGFQQRQQHLDIANQHAQTISDRLEPLYQAARKEASEAYGAQPKGTYEAQEIKNLIQETASSKLQGSTKLPAAVSKIIADIDKPPEPTLLDQASVFRGAGKEMRGAGKTVSEGMTPEVFRSMDPKWREAFLKRASPEMKERLAVPESTAQPAGLDAQRIHGFMSELGKAGRSASLSPDEASAINATRQMLEGRLRKLYDNEGRTSDFTKGQAAWKQMANTFENTKPTASGGSPIARALATKDPVTGKLRPDYIQSILSDDKAFPVAKDMLDRYTHLGSPKNELEVMKTHGDFADTLPSQVKWKGAPEGPNYPKFTEWGNMPKMPEEPMALGEIDPRQLKAEKLQKIADALQTMTSRWGAMGDIGGVLAAPFTGGKSLVFPARHPIGWALENPKIVRWLTEPSLEELNKIAPSKVALKRAMENAKP